MKIPRWLLPPKSVRDAIKRAIRDLLRDTADEVDPNKPDTP